MVYDAAFQLAVAALCVALCTAWHPVNMKMPSRFAKDVDPNNVLPEYPRPSLVRDNETWVNLNGIWQYELPELPTESIESNPGCAEPPLHRELTGGDILVPFAIEAPLSGVAKISPWVWYRRTFASPFSGRTLLHFGAVDWKCDVYVNELLVGSHTGGYAYFSFDITDVLHDNNTLVVSVYDPTEFGSQPFGKQNSSSMAAPNGNRYTSTTGIWGTVWLEHVPDVYVSDLYVETLNTSAIMLHTTVVGHDTAKASVSIYDADGKAHVMQRVASDDNVSIGQGIVWIIPNATMWAPLAPYIYTLTIDIESGDHVQSYFAMRTIGMTPFNSTAGPVQLLTLNGKPTYLTGFLDQSWWPGGTYTAPTDAALLSDINASIAFGFNFVRKHMKVEPERYYYYADLLGFVVQQDMPQQMSTHYSQRLDVSNFKNELAEMVVQRRKHACIIAWTIFNEGDCVNDATLEQIEDMVALIRSLDSTRLIDVNSGGPRNADGLGDFNDFHSYSSPEQRHRYASNRSADQIYAIGEYCGVAYPYPGHEWYPPLAHGQSLVHSSSELTEDYVLYASQLKDMRTTYGVSIAVCTQTSDVETESNGFLTYDRLVKFTPREVAAVRNATLSTQNLELP